MSHLIPRNYHSYKVEIPPGFFNLDNNQKEEKIKKTIKDVEERLKKEGRVAFPKALKEVNKMRNLSMFPLGGGRKSRKLVKKHNKRKSGKIKRGGASVDEINEDQRNRSNTIHILTQHLEDNNISDILKEIININVNDMWSTTDENGDERSSWSITKWKQFITELINNNEDLAWNLEDIGSDIDINVLRHNWIPYSHGGGKRKLNLKKMVKKNNNKRKSRKLVKKHNKRKSLKLKKGGTFTENINDDICVICQNELKNGESVYELSNCKHQIHSKCLNNYCEYPDSQIVIDGELRCPLCREPIKMEDCMDAWAKENDALGETPSELMGGKKNKK